MIALAVLAAGASTRYGSPKQLATIDGETLLHRATRVALEWTRNGHDRRAFVVLGANAELLGDEVAGGVAIVLNEHWQEGLSTSIHAAVRAANDADALILTLADQPGVTAVDLEQLTLAGAPIVAASYDGTTGVPARFARTHFEALLALRGDAGAKALLAHAATVPMPNAAWDIDTRGEYPIITVGPMRVLFLILLAFPALAAQPFAGAERPISPYRDAPRLGMKYSAVAAGGVGGFFAAWGEANDGFQVYGAYLTGDGKPATRPFLLGESYPTDLRVRSKGAGYVVTTDVPGFAWEVGPGYLIPVDSSPEPPVENASGEHLVITSEAGQFTVTFVDRNGQMHGPPIRTKELVSPSTVLHMLPAGDDWLLLVRGWNDSVQWTRLNHSGFAGSSVVLPVMPSTAYAGSRSFSELAVNGSSVSFAWTQSLKLDNVPNPEWERTLGYTVVDMQNGSSGETRIDSTRMRMGVYDSRTPTGGRPAALFDGREFVYAWTWLRYPGEAELRVVNGHGAPRVMPSIATRFPTTSCPRSPPVPIAIWCSGIPTAISTTASTATTSWPARSTRPARSTTASRRRW